MSEASHETFQLTTVSEMRYYHSGKRYSKTAKLCGKFSSEELTTMHACSPKVLCVPPVDANASSREIIVHISPHDKLECLHVMLMGNVQLDCLSLKD